jgi:hypothetical protein
MPKTTTSEVQAELFEYAQILLLSADALHDSAELSDDELSQLTEEEEIDNSDSSVIELLELEELVDAIWLTAGALERNKEYKGA